MTTYSAIDVAKRFLELAQRENARLSNMKLQKLVFFAQSLSLAMYGTPIHGNDSLAWDFGPVVRELYDLIRDLAAQRPDRQISLSDADVSAAFSSAREVEDAAALDVIQTVWDRFKGWTAMQLSNLTHRLDSPWALVYANRRYAAIPNSLILEKGLGGNEISPF